MIEVMTKLKDPIQKRKIDPRSNADDVSEQAAIQAEKEKNLYPLRITKNVIILVPKHKCNEEYARQYREKKLNVN